MPYNVPEEEKSAFNQKVKSSLELLTGDVSRTLGQLKVLQPETLVEAYGKPVVQQEALPPQEGVAPIVSEYQQPVGGNIMSVTPYQQAVTNASLAETDSLRNETGAIMDSPIEVFSKPLDRNKIKLLGLADDEMKPTEKGKLFYNLQEAGMFDGSGVITEKGAAYLTPINELGKPENLKAFQTLWDDKVIRPSASFGEITENTAKFLGDAVVGGAEGIALGAESVWRNSQTWSGLFGKADNRPQALRDKLTANNLGLIEGAVENLSGWAGMADVGAAWIGKKLYDVLPAGMEEEAEQAMYAARQRQWQTQQDIANLDAGEIAEAVLGIDNAVKEAEDAKSRMGKDAFDEKYRQAGAFSQLVADPTNYIPISAAINAAKMAPLANRLSITAQKRMTQIAAQDLAIAQGRTAIEAANSVLKKEAATVGVANRLGADITSRAGANPELVARANQVSQVAGRITQSADQIRATLPAVSAELEGLVAKRNSLATRIPEAYAQKVLQTMEVGRQARSMPAKAIGATLERVGDTLSKTDDAVTNFLKERGLDQMYTAAVGAAGVVGLAGSPIIGAIATGAAALKAGNMLSNYGKLFRYVGKEMENVRGQIPFWKRVAAHTAPNSLGRGIAHTFNMLDLGGVTSDVLRRTGRGIAAAAPSDLMFEYLSDGADMRPETLYQAASESLVIGGSFAAAGGAFMGTKSRMRELAIGDELNFRRDIVDTRQKALFDSVPSGIRKAIATYSIANPTLNYQFKDSGASQYDPNTNTATINVKSTNPIKALIAHETLHHTIIKNNMESGISALFLGDMKQNTVGGLFRSRDGKLDPNFEAFKDAYYKRLGVAEMSNAERDAIYPLDKVAVEYFIEKHSDQYSAMAESGELGGIAASGAVKRKLGSILETVLPRIPVLKDLHFKSGGMIDKDGSWVTGNGILDAEGIKTDPITNRMFRDMNRRSAGLATGQFEPLISDKADSGAQIILNPSDSIDSELLHPLVKTDDSGRPILENGKPVALDKATELERALAGLTALEVMRRKRSENYAPEKGEAYVDSEGEFQTGWLSDDVISEMFARNRFNPEQKRIIREVNKLVRKGTGDRVVMINFPATTRNKANKVIYKPQGATLRDTVPVAMTISKDGNLLFGLMSVTKLNENIAKRSQSKRGKRLYSGNVDLILKDTQAMMDYHKSGVDSIEYFSEKYGAVEADERKKFINTMFGLLNQKEQAMLNPMLLEDGIKSRDNVYRTYRADRVSKAVPMLPQDYPSMPFSYEATSQVKMPEQARMMPEPTSKEWNPNPIQPTNKIAKEKGIPNKITDDVFKLLEGKPIVVGMADLLGAGGKIRNIDVTGGPGYPVQVFDPANPLEITSVWVSQRQGVKGILQNMEKTNSIWKDESGHHWAIYSPHTMSQVAHKSNAQTPQIYISKVSEMASRGALSKIAATEISNHIRENVSLAKDMPDIGTAKLTKFIEDASFETRSAIMSELTTARSKAIGAPSPESILSETRDIQYHGAEKNALTGLLLIDIDRMAKQDANGKWSLRDDLSASDFGVNEHPSYDTVMPGRVLAHFDNPVPFGIAAPEMIKTMYKASPKSRPDYLLTKLPAEKGITFQPLTKDIADAINSAQDIAGNVPYIREVVKAANGNWKRFSGEGSLKGLTEFTNAIDRSPAKESLTQYDPKDVKKMIKNGELEVHQLGDNDIWFGVKKTKSGNDLVSVVNNTGIPGMLNVIMARALEAGVNTLDASSVVTPRTPNGLLPTLYERYGWKEVGRDKFDRKYLVEKSKSDTKEQHEAKIAQKEAALKMFWEEQGWDGKSMPDIVYMKHEGKTNGKQTGTIIDKRQESVFADAIGSTGAVAKTTADKVRGSGFSQKQGRGTISGASSSITGTGERVLPRGFDSVVETIRSASDVQLETMGLTSADKKKFLDQFGK